jgi:hypothetical protein
MTRRAVDAFECACWLAFVFGLWVLGTWLERVL